MFGIWFPGGKLVNRILKPVTYVLAAVYFLVDAVFMSVAKPISGWIARHLVLRGLRAWIRSLSPYPSLALFSVPVIILEPVKPVAAYLAATGQMLGGRPNIDHRRAPEARAGRASVQSHPRQIDEDSNIRLGLWQVPTRQSVVGSHAGMANHAVIKRGGA